MYKSDVEYKLGKPLYVQSGTKDLKKIIWVYEVRTIEIQSKKDESGIYNPTKSKYYISTRAKGNILKHSYPIHRIQIEFINNKVSRWGRLKKENSKEETIVEIESQTINPEDIINNPSDKKRATFFFDPKIMQRNDSWNIEYSSSNAYLREHTTRGSIGFNMGMKFEKYKIGLDLRIGSGLGLMLCFERNMNSGLNFLIGLGLDGENFESYEEYKDKEEVDYFYDAVKIGVFKFELSQNLGKLNFGIGTIPSLVDLGGMFYITTKFRLLN
jgi:hypothetical protein